MSFLFLIFKSALLSYPPPSLSLLFHPLSLSTLSFHHPLSLHYTYIFGKSAWSNVRLLFFKNFVSCWLFETHAWREKDKKKNTCMNDGFKNVRKNKTHFFSFSCYFCLIKNLVTIFIHTHLHTQNQINDTPLLLHIFMIFSQRSNHLASQTTSSSRKTICHPGKRKLKKENGY